MQDSAYNLKITDRRPQTCVLYNWKKDILQNYGELKKKQILNPILRNPWRSSAPILCTMYTKLEPRNDLNQAASASSATSVQKPKIIKLTSRERNARTLISRFPYFSKAKIKAALTLTDNNYLESVSLLESKLAFNSQRTLKKNRRKRNTRVVPTPHPPFSILKTALQPDKPPVLRLGTFPKAVGVEAVLPGAQTLSCSCCRLETGGCPALYPNAVWSSSEAGNSEKSVDRNPDCDISTASVLKTACSPAGNACSSKTHCSTSFGSTSSTVTASSDVYEFSDTELFEVDGLRKPKRRPMNKIGVVLKRLREGFYTVTIM